MSIDYALMTMHLWLCTYDYALISMHSVLIILHPFWEIR